MGTKFSSKVFLWMLTSSSCRVANKVVVPFTKVSIFYSSNVFFKPIFLCFFVYIMCWLGTHFLTVKMDYTALSLLRSQLGEKQRSVERDTPGPCHHIESEIMSIDGEDGGWQVAGAVAWRRRLAPGGGGEIKKSPPVRRSSPTTCGTHEPSSIQWWENQSQATQYLPLVTFLQETNVGQEEGGG